MSKGSDQVKTWRQAFRRRCLDAFGSKCGICGYSLYCGNLQFHHLDPDAKEVTMGSIRRNPKAWPDVVAELRKCVLLCNRCHGEVHAGITKIHQDITHFNEDFADYEKIKNGGLSYVETHPCPVCGAETPDYHKYCSHRCSSKDHRRVDWDSIDLAGLLHNSNYSAVGRSLGVSDQAVRKRAKKLGLI